MPQWTRESLAELIHRILRDDLLEVTEDFTPRSNLIEAGLDSLAVRPIVPVNGVPAGYSRTSATIPSRLRPRPRRRGRPAYSTPAKLC